MKKLITLLLLATGVASGITVTIDNVVAAHQDLPQSEAYTGRLGELVFNMGKDPANNATNIHNGFITMYNGIDDGGRAIQPGLDPATHIFVKAEYSGSSNGSAGGLANGIRLKNAIAYAKTLRKTLTQDGNYRNDIFVYVPSGFYEIPEPLDVTDTSIRIIGTAGHYITGKKRGINLIANNFHTYGTDDLSPGTLIKLAASYTGTHTGTIFLAGNPSAGQSRLVLENVHVFGNIKATGSSAGFFHAQNCILEGDIYNETIDLQGVVLKNTGLYGQGLAQVQEGTVDGCIFVSDGSEQWLADVHNMAFVDCYFDTIAGCTINQPSQYLYFYDCFWDTTCTDWFPGAPGFGGGSIEFRGCELAGANAANWFDDRIAASGAINDSIKFFYCTELPTEIATEAGFHIRYCVDENDSNVSAL